MRRAFLSAAIALVGAASIAASGWALQAAALPPPTRADRMAAEVSAWFREYRLSVDVFHLGHRRVEGACLRGWFGHAHGRKAPGSLLSLEPDLVLRVSGTRVKAVDGRPGRGFPRFLAATAGCGAELGHLLVAAAQGTGHLSVSRAYAARRPAVALELSRGKHERLTVYASPETARPLVAVVALRGREVAARIYVTGARRRLLRHFHLLGRLRRKRSR